MAGCHCGAAPDCRRCGRGGPTEPPSPPTLLTVSASAYERREIRRLSVPDRGSHAGRSKSAAPMRGRECCGVRYDSRGTREALNQRGMVTIIAEVSGWHLSRVRIRRDGDDPWPRTSLPTSCRRCHAPKNLAGTQSGFDIPRLRFARTAAAPCATSATATACHATRPLC